MDSREPSQPQTQPPNLMVGPSPFPNTMTPSMMAPATARFPPFNTNTNTNNPPPGSFNNDAAPCGLASDSSNAKKKRGRPRKYSPDGNIALGLAPTHVSTPSSSSPVKKSRGRPPGSGKKQLDALGNGGTGFTPHVILVDTGEDIVAKIMAFCQQAPRTLCVLSGNGSVSNVTIGQPTVDGGTVTFEGQFNIVSLTGSIHLSENNSGSTRLSGLNVSVGGSDGRVLGGGVAGKLTAASPVQVIVGSFVAGGKKSSSNNLKSGPSSTPTSQMLTFGAPVTSTSPTSQGPSTESSDDNENSHFSKGPGLYNNATQPIHNNMPMYHHQLWASQTQQ